MSKKTNTLLFILGGTVFNILITILSFILLWVLCSIFLFPRLGSDSPVWGGMMAGIFVASIIVSFVVYRLVLKIIMKKVNMEKYFDPIFGPRHKPRPKD